MILPVSQVVLFAILIVSAMVNIRRPEWHKRFMRLARLKTEREHLHSFLKM